MNVLNYLSFITGKISAVPVPKALRPLVIGSFAKLIHADLSESEILPEQSQSVQAFFTRNLKSGLRPINGTFVSPVDGTLRGAAPITSKSLIQAKGKEYSIAELLGDELMAADFFDGTSFNLYLAPCDYHHVHFPVNGQIFASTYIPGALWPVNDWALNRVNFLFARNERLITYIQSELGLVAVVMVGAFNVGKMTVSFDSWTTNQLRREGNTREYDQPKAISIGARLGTFHLGSTVIMLVSKKFAPEAIRKPGKIRYGEAIVNI